MDLSSVPSTQETSQVPVTAVPRAPTHFLACEGTNTHVSYIWICRYSHITKNKKKEIFIRKAYGTYWESAGLPNTAEATEGISCRFSKLTGNSEAARVSSMLCRFLYGHLTWIYIWAVCSAPMFPECRDSHSSLGDPVSAQINQWNEIGLESARYSQ